MNRRIQLKLYFLFTLFIVSNIFSQNLDEKDNLIKGNLNYNSNKFIEAETYYKEAIKSNKESVTAKYNYGNSVFKQNKTDEAIKEFDSSLKLAKSKEQKSRIYHNMGNAYMKINDYEKAKEAFKNSLLNNPSDDETRYNYALSKLKHKKEEDKKPQQQKDKEKKEKQEKENQQSKDNKDSSKDKKENKSQENQKKEDQKKDNKDADEKGDKNKLDNKNDNENNKQDHGNNKKLKVDPNLMKNLLKAVERQEQETHKKVIQNNKVFPIEKNSKDW